MRGCVKGRSYYTAGAVRDIRPAGDLHTRRHRLTMSQDEETERVDLCSHVHVRLGLLPAAVWVETKVVSVRTGSVRVFLG